MKYPPTEVLSQGVIRLRMFDVQAVIESDSESFVRFIQRMYHRFLVDKFSDSNLTLEFAFFTQQNNQWKEPVLVLAGEPWVLDEGGILEAYAYDGILNTILSKVRSHFLIHAGVVDRQGQGVILVAEAGFGKTTLTMELVRRGFNFLSDEVAALSRSDYRLDAFPRSLRVRPTTLNLIGLKNKVTEPPLDFGKYLLDIEKLFPGSLVESASIKYVFLLNEELNVNSSQNENTGNEFAIYLDRIDDELMNEIRAVKDILQVRRTIELGFPVLRINANQKMRAISDIEKICQQRGIHILEISKRLPVTPSFSKPAMLEEIPKSQAVQGMLRQFQPGNKSELLEKDFGGNPTRMFIAIARMLEHAKCYRLSVGPLNEMANLVESVIE